MSRLNREIRKTVRLNDAEWQKLQQLCKDKGQTLSEWVRDKIRLARTK